MAHKKVISEESMAKNGKFMFFLLAACRCPGGE